MTARREYGAAIVACVAGAGLVLLALRQGWARVDYAAPKPLPSGSIQVSGQDLLPAVGALALAALACLAAIIATRGLARRVAGLALAGLGVWIVAQVSQPLHAATIIAAASGQAASGGLGGSLPGGNSAISGSSPAGGGLPEIGAASRAVLDSVPWRPVAVLGAAAIIVAGLLAAWHGPRWAVMSARFDRPSQPAGPATPLAGGATAPSAPAPAPPATGPPATGPSAPGPAIAPAPGPATAPAPAPPATGPSAPAPAAEGRPAAAPGPAAEGRPVAAPAPAAAPAAAAPATPAAAGPIAPRSTEATADWEHPQPPGNDAAALWEALDRGVDLTDTPNGDAEPVAAPARGEEQ